ncbi:MAG: glycosyltransferase family 2 protein [Flavobacteriaceae bacterium]|nr:glycosyltransferase family 2 protein [Bacteroidia bacterium]NNF74723.1 glycosyltransferase family 2 protein [Flavobacteriaceae bacterium]NNK73758.1 glycosyltransferase family 2 protein [Flavobacteriaceae bacterium]
MKLAVVILNWNGRSLLDIFLKSVVEHTSGHDIYVIDNASTDDSINFIEKNYPKVRLIKLSENLGYAGGYNEGLKQVKADIYCLLNNDVEVTANWTEPILKAFQKDTTLAAAQPKILDYNDKSKFEYAGAAGGFIDRYGFPYCRGRLFETIESDNGQYDSTAEVFWASGACFFVRESSFDLCQGLDSSFFAHMEEVDLCWRLINKGCRIKCVGDSTVYHVGGATLSQGNAHKTYLNFRNSLFMLYKNLPGKTLLPVLFTRLILDGIAGLKFLFEVQGSHTLAVLRAHWSFYNSIARMKSFRKDQNHQKNYFAKRSIVWSYFVKGIREYSRL